MSVKYLPLSDAAERTGLSQAFLEMLAREEMIELKRTLDDVVVISSSEIERAQVIAVLTEELEVNLPGAEVIIHMRDEMIAMQRQFEEILRSLVEELKRDLTARDARPANHPDDLEGTATTVTTQGTEGTDS